MPPVNFVTNNRKEVTRVSIDPTTPLPITEAAKQTASRKPASITVGSTRREVPAIRIAGAIYLDQETVDQPAE
jgi:hypothetical protein